MFTIFNVLVLLSVLRIEYIRNKSAINEAVKSGCGNHVLILILIMFVLLFVVYCINICVFVF